MKVRGLARKEERSHNQPAKGDVILGQVHSDLSTDISKIYALDLFINNPDRHLDNYMVVKNGASHAIFAFDYSRAWLHGGFPPAGLPAGNTVNWKNWFKANFPGYFNPGAANGILDMLSQINSAQITGIIGRHPNNWLSQPELDAIIAWWDGGGAAARVTQIRDGIADGTLT